MTYSILRGLTWEYLRRAWWLALVAVGAMVGGPLMFLGLVALKLQMGEAGVEFRPLEMHFPYLGMSAVAWGFVATVPTAECRPRIYSLPVSTQLLVGWLLVVSLVTTALLSLVTMVLYRTILGVTDWPWLGPTLLAMTLVSIKQCFVWYLLVPRTGTNSRYVWHACRTVALIIPIVAAVIFWVDLQYQAPQGSKVPWVAWEVSLGDILTLAAVTAIAWWATVKAAEKHRHSDLATAPEWDAESNDPAIDADPLPGWVERLRMSPRIRNANHALACLHWHDGLALAIVLAIGWGGIMMSGLAALFNKDNTGEVVEGTFVFFTIFPALGGMFIGTILGAQSIGKQAGGPMPPFVGTTPVSDAQLSWSFITNLLKTVTLFWGMLIIAAGTFAVGNIYRLGIDRFVQLWQEPDAPVVGMLGSAWFPVFMLFSFLVTWTGAGLTVAAMWAGRTWCQMALMSSVIMIMIVPMIVLPMYPPEQRDIIARAGMYGLGSILALATLMAFVKALRRRLIRPRMAWFAAGAWGAEAAILCATLPVAAGYQVSLSGVLATSIAPLAIGPLALSWNRHR